MALFDKKPELRLNSFTLKEAGEVFKKAAEDLESESLPSEAVDILLALSRAVLTTAQLFATK